MNYSSLITANFIGRYFLIVIIVAIMSTIANWIIFEKAGEEGWQSLIPIWSSWKLFEITYGEGWKFVLVLIPVVGKIVPMIQAFRLGQTFGKDTAFNIGLALITPIFLLILAFSDSYYEGPVESFL